MSHSSIHPTAADRIEKKPSDPIHSTTPSTNDRTTDRGDWDNAEGILAYDRSAARTDALVSCWWCVLIPFLLRLGRHRTLRLDSTRLHSS